MKLLIVEDDPNKLHQLHSYVHGLYPEAVIGQALSYNSGLQKILHEEFSAILLDMQLPTFDKSPTEPGGRQRALAGQQILRRMLRDRISTPVIVVTQFERFGEGEEAISLSELSETLRNGGFPNYVDTIYYHANLSDWKASLRNHLEAVTRKL